VAVIWPGDLPDCFQVDGFVEARADNLIRSSAYGGFITEVRRRSTINPFPVVGTMFMTTDEWDTFWAFFRDLADGALAFEIPAQGTTDTLTNWVSRFLKPPSRRFAAEDLWLVSFELEVVSTVESEPPILPGPHQNVATFFAATVAIFNTDFTLVPQRYTDPDEIYTGFILLDQDLVEPQRITDADVLYAPSVTRGARTLTAGLVTDADTIYSSVVSGAFTTLAPNLYTDADTFYAPTIVRSVRTLTPARYDDADTFYAPTITRGARTIAPSLYTDADTFYAPTMLRGVRTLTPAKYDDADTFYAPDVAVLEEALLLRDGVSYLLLRDGTSHLLLGH